ncbi:hypothetical protein C4579_00590 [Candidatus Microgenomates bacterium]|nr:MAG: hypothetical protein C4579_00590 [Candidatus Microgenomates bacterium]
MRFVVIVFLLAIVGLSAFFVYRMYRNNSSAQESNLNENISPSENPSAEMTLQGTYICLPHKDTSGPQTLECAFGLQTSEGNFALDTSPLAQDVMVDFPIGELIQVTGFVTPLERLSPDSPQRKYDIAGTVVVTSISSLSNNSDNSLLQPTASTTTSISNITFTPPNDFGLAVSQDQILIDSAVPPCDQSFNYCLYYNGTNYKNTHFESAGIRIENRTDLETTQSCLLTQPQGFANLSPSVQNYGDYETSVFAPVRFASTSQSSRGKLYRLAREGSCWEFETRVGITRFEDFPQGIIEPFTNEDLVEIESKLDSIMRNIHFVDSTNAIFTV